MSFKRLLTLVPRTCRAARNHGILQSALQNLVNLEAARGRIMDTDVALESSVCQK